MTRILYHGVIYVQAAPGQSKWVRVIRKRDGKVVQVRRGKETDTKKYKLLKPGKGAQPAKTQATPHYPTKRVHVDDHGALGRSLQHMTREVKQLQTKFLKSRGLSWEQAQAMKPRQREQLQRHYKEWLAKESPSAALKVRLDSLLRGQDAGSRAPSGKQRRHMTNVLRQRAQRKQEREQAQQQQAHRAKQEQRYVAKKDQGRTQALGGAAVPAEVQQLSDDAHRLSATAHHTPAEDPMAQYLAHNAAWDAHILAADRAAQLGHPALAKWHNQHVAKHEKLQQAFGERANQQQKQVA